MSENARSLVLGLVVWRLDRLGRSLRDLINWAEYLEGQNVGLQSLQEALDTSTPSGKLTFHLFGALAEFERNLIQERTQAGLAAARARGRTGGRPKRLSSENQKLAVRLYNEKQHPIAKIWVYPNKGTRSPTGLRLISDTHDGLPTGLKMACDG